ncbi:hypothetical protein [Staphylococcus epidermidis]|nr:hypothetical protein [Staphylococcus epidermidis]
MFELREGVGFDVEMENEENGVKFEMVELVDERLGGLERLFSSGY